MGNWRRAIPHVAAPFHPIAVHYVIALTSVSLGFDTLAWLTGNASLSSAGWWTLALAIPATLAALVTGVVSRRRLPMEEGSARRYLRLHMALGPMFFGLLLTCAVWRSVLWDAGAFPTWRYLALLGATCLVMAVQGFFGGELVYAYGAEVESDYRRLPVAKPPAGDGSRAPADVARAVP